MAKKQILDEIIAESPDRRSFLTKLAMAGAAVTALGGVKLANGRLADVAPTLLDLMGLPMTPQMTGHSLIELAESAA